jgi:dihydropteroate synthase
MGILNATPDSFSDGGLHDAPEAALAHALRLEAAGADWIDVGAESTRPGFVPVDPEEEWARLGPVLEALRGKVRVPLSVDTRHAETARRAFAAGAAMLNDVGGLADPGLLAFARDGDFPVVLMHGMAHVLPPDEAHPADAIARWFEERIGTLGIDPARLVLDPGIGFGTTRGQDAALVRDPAPLARLGLPLLYGLSRKRVLALLAPGAADRDAASAAWSWHAWRHGTSILRLHALPAAPPPSPLSPPSPPSPPP